MPTFETAFSTPDGAKQAAEVSKLMSDVQAMIALFKETLQNVQKESVDTRQAFIAAVAEATGRAERIRQELAQASVIHSGEGTLFSLRYRNDTATGNAAGIHRLEYIAKSSPYIPDDDGNPTAVMWPDAEWTAVPGGDAVELDLSEEEP
jgi:hypothetical protein